MIADPWVTKNAEFEAKHPRAADGEFVEVGGKPHLNARRVRELRGRADDHKRQSEVARQRVAEIHQELGDRSWTDQITSSHLRQNPHSGMMEPHDPETTARSDAAKERMTKLHQELEDQKTAVDFHARQARRHKEDAAELENDPIHGRRLEDHVAMGKDKTKAGKRARAAEHREAVESAIEAGETIPDAVLEDYLDLKTAKSLRCPWLVTKGRAGWDEHKHPRDHGQFSSGAGAAGDRHNPDLDAVWNDEPAKAPAKPTGPARHNPDLDAAMNGDEPRYPSRHNPDVDYGHADDRDSDDKHIDRLLAGVKQAQAEVVAIKQQIAKLEKKRDKRKPINPKIVENLKAKLATATEKAQTLKAKAEALKAGSAERLAGHRAELAASKERQRAIQEQMRAARNGRAAIPGLAATSPAAKPQAAPPATSGAPHERTQAAALQAANAAVQALRSGQGGPAAHKQAIAALDAHLKEGLAELDRRGGSPGSKQRFAAKIQAAKAKLAQIAQGGQGGAQGRQTPPSNRGNGPQRGGNARQTAQPPPLPNRSGAGRQNVGDVKASVAELAQNVARGFHPSTANHRDVGHEVLGRLRKYPPDVQAAFKQKYGIRDGESPEAIGRRFLAKQRGGYSKDPGLRAKRPSPRRKAFACPWLVTKAKGGEGRWITIGGEKGADGKRHGGSPVYIENGRITKGHPSLIGKDPANLAGEAEHGGHRRQLNQSKDYEKAKWRKKARKEGHDPEHLESLAGEVKRHHDAFAEERKDVHKFAREHSAKNFGADLRSVGANARHGSKDHTSIRGFDETTEATRNAFPHHFHEETGEHGSHSDQLHAMLVGGDPKPMEWDEAYSTAFDQLGEPHGKPKADDDFSFGANVSPDEFFKAFAGFDLAVPATDAAWVMKSRDATGHEHAADGRFGTTAGSHGGKSDRHSSPSERPGHADGSSSKAAKLAAKASSVPRQLRAQVHSFVRSRYRKLSKRYGPKGAYAILGAVILLLPAPVPGSSLIPIAVAECVLAIRRAVSKSHDDLDDETIQREARRLVRDLYAACGATWTGKGADAWLAKAYIPARPEVVTGCEL